MIMVIGIMQEIDECIYELSHEEAINVLKDISRKVDQRIDSLQEELKAIEEYNPDLTEE